MRDMSLDVLDARFEAHRVECSNDRIRIVERLDKVSVELDAKVEWKQFWAVLGILVTIMTGICGYISFQLKNLADVTYATNEKASSVQGDVSFLRGKLSPYDVEFVK